MKRVLAYSIIALLTLGMVIPVLADQSNCPRCGQSYEVGSTYCGGCGSRLPDRNQNNQYDQISPYPKEVRPLSTLDPSIVQLIGKMSDEDLRRLVFTLLQSVEKTNAQASIPPNSVALMSRQELEDLLAKHSGDKPLPSKESSFGSFLKFVGGTFLFILAISILVSF